MLKKLLFCFLAAVASAFSQAPNVGTISPAGLTKPGASFTFTITDPYGVGDISQLLVVIKPTGQSPNLPVSNSCYITYTQSPWWGAFLWNDGGTNAANYGPDGVNWTGSGTNSYCGVAGWSHTISGNTLTVTLPITFKSLNGPVDFFTSITSNAFGASGWETWHSIWTAGTAAPPSVSLSGPSLPTSGFGGTFSVSSTDAAGTADIIAVQLLLPHNCALSFNGSTQFYLIYDDWSNWYGPLTVGGPGRLQNSACWVDASAVSISDGAYTRNISASVVFKPQASAVTGPVQMVAVNQAFQYTNGGYQNFGNWTIPALPALPAVITDGPEIQQPPAYDQYTGTMLSPPTNTTTGLQLVRATTAPDFGSVVHNSDTFTASIVGAPPGSTVFVTVAPVDAVFPCPMSNGVCTSPYDTDVNWCGFRPNVTNGGNWAPCGPPGGNGIGATGTVGPDGTLTLSGSFANMRATEWSEDWLVVFSSDGLPRHLGAAYFIQ